MFPIGLQRSGLRGGRSVDSCLVTSWLSWQVAVWFIWSEFPGSVDRISLCIWGRVWSLRIWVCYWSSWRTHSWCAVFLSNIVFFFNFKTFLCVCTNQRVGFWWPALPSHPIEVRSFLFQKSLCRLAGPPASGWLAYFHLPSHCMNAGLTNVRRCIWPFTWVLGLEPRPSDW